MKTYVICLLLSLSALGSLNFVYCGENLYETQDLDLDNSTSDAEDYSSSESDLDENTIDDEYLSEDALSDDNDLLDEE